MSNTLIEWNTTLSVNVAEIDTQHQKLIGLINQLYELMKSGQAHNALGAVLADLIDYATVHFRTEEDYFTRFHYPESIAHRLEHKAFVDKVKAFQTQFEGSNTFLTIEIMQFLKDWLVKHINGTDKRYTKCFNEHGLH